MSPQERTSDILIRILAANDQPRLTIGEFVDRLGDRAFGILILVFALPNCVPGPPGLSVLTGIPVVIVAWQMMTGRDTPWMPGFLARRSFPRADLLRVVQITQPYLRRLERLSKPRLTRLMQGPWERVLGVVLFILSIVLTAPIPFGNLFPAIAIAIIALAIVEHDGVTLIIGYVAGLLSVLIAMGVLVTIFAVMDGVIDRVAS